MWLRDLDASSASLNAAKTKANALRSERVELSSHGNEALEVRDVAG